ncbi:hypothetical protein OROHE_010677 [Orobanche hederae]
MGFSGCAEDFKILDFSLRLVVVPFNVASIWIAVGSHQNNSDYGKLEFSNFIGFKYMVCIIAVSAGYALFAAVSSLYLRCLLTKAWILFVTDQRINNFVWAAINQVLAYLMVTSMAALGEFLYLAYNGDQKVSWSRACDSYGTFCSRLKLALATHAIAVCCFLGLAVISGYRVFRRFEPPLIPSKECEKQRS